MSIRVKLFICSEEREVLHTNVDYHRFTRFNGKPSSWVMGRYLTVTFRSQMYDDSFIEWMLADRSDNKSGLPTQNAFIERFNGSYRRGVLDKYIFEDLNQVREQSQIWMQDYNHHRPHEALGNIPPKEYAKITSVGVNPNRSKKTIYLKKYWNN